MYDEDEFPNWADVSTVELVALALGDDVWLNAPALGALGDRSPEIAERVALEALERDDSLLVAAAIRVLADCDLDKALIRMSEMVSEAPIGVLEAMAEVLAVDHPIEPSRAPKLLDHLLDRLWPPAGSREYNAASLLRQRYELGKRDLA